MLEGPNQAEGAVVGAAVGEVGDELVIETLTVGIGVVGVVVKVGGVSAVGGDIVVMVVGGRFNFVVGDTARGVGKIGGGGLGDIARDVGEIGEGGLVGNNVGGRTRFMQKGVESMSCSTIVLLLLPVLLWTYRLAWAFLTAPQAHFRPATARKGS